MNKPAEKKNLIYKILNFPVIYNAYQNFIFKKKSKNIIFNQFINIEDNDFVLDVGCGPGNYRNLIKTKNYYGIDINCKSIETARNNYPEDIFHCLPVQEITKKIEQKFDKVILIGLLHHLSDIDVIRLFLDLRSMIDKGSEIFCLDTSFDRDQNIFSKTIAKLDKGNYVRYPEHLKKLVETDLYNIHIEMFNNLLRLPCHHSLLKLTLK
jgi:SAM-dependent methyltransferase